MTEESTKNITIPDTVPQASDNILRTQPTPVQQQAQPIQFQQQPIQRSITPTSRFQPQRSHSVQRVVYPQQRATYMPIPTQAIPQRGRSTSTRSISVQSAQILSSSFVQPPQQRATIHPLAQTSKSFISTSSSQHGFFPSARIPTQQQQIQRPQYVPQRLTLQAPKLNEQNPSFAQTQRVPLSQTQTQSLNQLTLKKPQFNPIIQSQQQQQQTDFARTSKYTAQPKQQLQQQQPISLGLGRSQVQRSISASSARGQPLVQSVRRNIVSPSPLKVPGVAFQNMNQSQKSNVSSSNSQVFLPVKSQVDNRPSFRNLTDSQNPRVEKAQLARSISRDSQRSGIFGTTSSIQRSQVGPTRSPFTGIQTGMTQSIIKNVGGSQNLQDSRRNRSPAKQRPDHILNFSRADNNRGNYQQQKQKPAENKLKSFLDSLL